MNRISRRSLAKYAAQQIADGVSAEKVAKYIASALIESRRTDESQFLIGDIAWELEQRGLLATARVTTATQLTEELQNHIKSQIKQVTRTDEVLLDQQIDKSVIGGLRVETAQHVWDTSVKRKLSDLRGSV